MSSGESRSDEAVPSNIAGERRYLGVSFEITERKRAEENLRLAEAVLRELNRSLERKAVQEGGGARQGRRCARQACARSRQRRRSGPP